MTSILSLVDSTISDYLMTGQRVGRAKLTTTLDASETTIVVNSELSPVGPGTLVQAGFELMTVWSGTSPSWVVQRGDYGTTGAVHTADDVMELNPIFPRDRVLNAINTEITSLNMDPGIWAETLIEFTSGSDLTEVYDLGAVEVKGIAAVDQLVDEVWTPIIRFDIKRGLTGQTGITGDAGIQMSGAYSNRTTRVVAKTPLTNVDSTTADVETTSGVTNPRLLAVGAAIQLNAGREIKRSFIEHQGSSRRANEVQPFQTLSSGRELRALYKQLKGEAITSLVQRYPNRRKVR